VFVRDFSPRYKDSFEYSVSRKTETAREIAEREAKAREREAKYREELRISKARTKPIENAVNRLSRIKEIDVKFIMGTQISRVYARLIVASEREYAFIIDADETGAFSVYDNGRVDDYYRNRRCSSFDRNKNFEGRRDTAGACLRSLATILKRHYPQKSALIEQAIFKGLEPQRPKPQKTKLRMC
jgi:hypothetical protein